MSYPFLRQQPVAEGARIIRRAFQINRVLRDRQDPLAQRYRCYLHNEFVGTTLMALSFYTIGDEENLVKRAVCCAIRTMYLALKQFLRVFVVFPSYLRPQVVNMCPSGFPKVIGAIHCTHIPIKAPPGPNEGDFVNRKVVHSVNVQMVCGSMHLITNVEAKWPGSVHDSRIFREFTVLNTLMLNLTKQNFPLKDFSRIPVVGVQPDDDLQPVHLDQPSGRATDVTLCHFVKEKDSQNMPHATKV
uniref:DDE Tnp4 domain-containing protein n=1 Tax=Fundulus heteroclitus TaxID=8078 RepID=A0A3Q2TDG6_FUNHE